MNDAKFTLCETPNNRSDCAARFRIKAFMWKKRRALWVVDEGEKRIADRPHWITITIGLLSPLLACVAVWVSLQAFHTSERALKIGNRAYVAVLGGQLQFVDFGIVYNDTIDKSQHCIVRMDLSANIQNAGNTPASESVFKPKYRLPKGWSEAPVWVKQGLGLGGPSIGIIGPKSTVNWSYTDLFELTPDSYSAFRTLPGMRFVYVEAEVDYKDLFSESNAVNWCWAAVTNGQKTETTDCKSALKPVLGPP